MKKLILCYRPSEKVYLSFDTEDVEEACRVLREKWDILEEIMVRETLEMDAEDVGDLTIIREIPNSNKVIVLGTCTEIRQLKEEVKNGKNKQS